MDTSRRDRAVLHFWALRHCRLALALLGLLPLVLPLPLLWPEPPIGPSARLPGVPVAVAVDAATHQVVLATAAAEALLTLDSSSGAVLGGVALPGDFSEAVAVDPLLRHVYVATARSGLLVLAGPSGTPLATILLDQQPVAVAVNSATGRVYVATRRTNGHQSFDALVVLDGLRRTILTELPLGQGPLRVAVDPATNRVYVTDDGSDTLTVLDGTGAARLATLPLGSGPHEVAVGARTGRVYISNRGGRSVSVLDGAHERLLVTTAAAGRPGALAVNERTDRVYTADSTGAVVVLDGTTGRLLGRVRVGPWPAGLAVDGDRNRVFVTDFFDGTVWLIQEHRFGQPTAHIIARADRAVASPPEDPSACGC